MTARLTEAFTVFISACLFAQFASAQNDVTYKKGYVDGPYGQIHYHTAQLSSGSSSKTPVVFIHQIPRSAEEYRPLLNVVGRSRLAIAFDWPGYGESDRPESPPSTAEIASAKAVALEELGYGPKGMGKVDVFGWHTATFVAADLAILRSDLVRQVVLAGIVYLPKEERLQRLAELPRGKGLAEDGARVLGRWTPIVNRRPEEVPRNRAARVFLEDIRSLDKYWYGYDAAWRFEPEVRLPMIGQPLLVLQPHEPFKDLSLKAHREIIPHADLIELPSVTDDVFDTGSEEIGAALVKWLDKPK